MFVARMVGGGVVLAVVVLVGCAQTHKVVPIAAATEGDFVYYALPRAVIDVAAVVSVSSVDLDPPCANTPERKELGLSAPKIDGQVSPTPAPRIVKFFGVYEVKLAKHSEADPGERYAIDLDGTGAAELGVAFDGRGALTKASSESTDVIVPLIVGATEFAASIAGKVFLAGAPVGSRPPSYCTEAKAKLLDARRRLTELYSAMGAANPKDIIELKAAKLTTLAKSLEFPFTGVKPGQPQIVTCAVRPAPSQPIDTKLFDWTKRSGLQPLPGVTCEVPGGLTIDAGDQATSTDANEGKQLAEAHTFALRVQPLGTDLTGITQATASGKDRSFYYRVPAFSGVEAGDVTPAATWTRVSDHFEWPIPQLGKVFSLPRLRSTRNVKSTATLDPETGALLEAGSKNAEADFGAALAGIGKSAVGVLDARKAAQAHDDELEKLQRESAVLEARVAIKVAKEALGEQ